MENIYDIVLSRTLARVEKVSDRIARNFKGVNPFDKEKVDPKEAMLDYEDLMSREADPLTEEEKQIYGYQPPQLPNEG